MSFPIDLDALAAGYEHRPAGDAALAHARGAAEDAGLRAGDWAVDVGGGPGEHAAVWTERGVRAVVVDPARPMVARAARRDGVYAVCGRGERLPFAAATMGLVYFHLSIHYGDWRRTLDEAVRVLAPRGEVCIWTLGPAHHATSMTAEYFPSVRPIDELRFPEPNRLVRHLRSLELDVEEAEATEVKKRTAASWVAAVEARFISTLQLIDEGEITAGLERFRRAHPDPTEEVVYTLEWHHIRAYRPGRGRT